MFNPDQFLNAEIDAANDTEVLQIPVGQYLAISAKVETKQWTSKEDPTKTGQRLVVSWEIDDEQLKEYLGRAGKISQSIMLDLTDDGRLDTGKGRNAQLGRLRAALGLNNPGERFTLGMLSGRVAKIEVGHRLDDKSQTRADVNAVMAL